MVQFADGWVEKHTADGTALLMEVGSSLANVVMKWKKAPSPEFIKRALAFRDKLKMLNIPELLAEAEGQGIEQPDDYLDADNPKAALVALIFERWLEQQQRLSIFHSALRAKLNRRRHAICQDVGPLFRRRCCMSTHD